MAELGPSLEAVVFTAPDGSCRVWYCEVAPPQRRAVSQTLRRFLLARQLRDLWSRPVAPEALAFAAEPGTKPRLLAEAAVDFSVAYGPGAVAIGIQLGGCIGVDTTPIDPAFAFASVVDAFFTAAEAAYIAAAAPSLRPAFFARLWARREAYLKATGTGVAGLDRRVDVLAASLAGPPRLYLHDLDLGGPAAAALCVATDHKHDIFTVSHEVLTLAHGRPSASTVE